MPTQPRHQTRFLPRELVRLPQLPAFIEIGRQAAEKALEIFELLQPVSKNQANLPHDQKPRWESLSR